MTIRGRHRLAARFEVAVLNQERCASEPIHTRDQAWAAGVAGLLPFVSEITALSRSAVRAQRVELSWLSYSVWIPSAISQLGGELSADLRGVEWFAMATGWLGDCGDRET